MWRLLPRRRRAGALHRGGGCSYGPKKKNIDHGFFRAPPHACIRWSAPPRPKKWPLFPPRGHERLFGLFFPTRAVPQFSLLAATSCRRDCLAGNRDLVRRLATKSLGFEFWRIGLILPIVLFLFGFAQELSAEQEAVSWNEQGMIALESEDFATASRAFARAKELNPASEIYSINLSRCSQRMARRYEKEEQLIMALDAWRFAGKAHLDEGRPQSGEANLLLRLGRRGEAEELVQQILFANPQRISAVLLHSRLLLLRGAHVDAIALLESALQDHPKEVRLQKNLASAQKERDEVAGFLRNSSAHFDFLFDPSRIEIVRAMPDLIGLFEQACMDVNERFGLPMPEHLLVIVLDPASYRSDGDSWSAGKYDGRIRLPVADFFKEQDRLARVARHEFAHATLDRIGVKIPSWFHEGIAQLAEGSSVSEARASLHELGTTSLSNLEGDWSVWQDRDRVQRGYASALSFCAWMRSRAGASIYDLLFQAMPQGGFQAAMERSFSMELAALSEEHRRFLEMQ